MPQISTKLGSLTPINAPEKQDVEQQRQERIQVRCQKKQSSTSGGSAFQSHSPTSTAIPFDASEDYASTVPDEKDNDSDKLETVSMVDVVATAAPPAINEAAFVEDPPTDSGPVVVNVTRKEAQLERSSSLQQAILASPIHKIQKERSDRLSTELHKVENEDAAAMLVLQEADRLQAALMKEVAQMSSVHDNDNFTPESTQSVPLVSIVTTSVDASAATASAAGAGSPAPSAAAKDPEAPFATKMSPSRVRLRGEVNSTPIAMAKYAQTKTKAGRVKVRELPRHNTPVHLHQVAKNVRNARLAFASAVSPKNAKKQDQ